MSDTALATYLMGIFKTFDKFTLMGKALMKKNLDATKGYSNFDGSEAHLAAMVARAHNGGSWKRSFSSLTSPNDASSGDQNHYVKYFLGQSGYRAKGDWYSLRCTESFGTNTVKPGTQGKGIGGLQMTPLALN